MSGSSASLAKLVHPTLGVAGRSRNEWQLRRAEWIAGVVRASLLVLSVVTIATAPHSLPGGRAAQVEHAALLVPTVAALWVSRQLAERGLRQLAMATTALDVVFFVAYTAHYHSRPGLATSMGLLAFLEGPLRWGLRGLVATTVPVTITATLWPQVDNSGARPSFAATMAVVLLLLLPVALLRRHFRRTAHVADLAEGQFRDAFSYASVGLALLDADGEVLAANAKLASLAGMSAAEMIGLDLAALLGVRGGPVERLRVALDDLRDGGSSRSLEVRAARTGAWVRLTVSQSIGRADIPTRFLLCAEDISEQQRTHAHLVELATRDDLSGLLNRRGILDAMTESLDQASASTPMAVLLADLDGFKTVNDKAGHAAGDSLLTDVARRMAGTLRAGEQLGRLGGDEFLLIVPGDESYARSRAGELLDCLRREVPIPTDKPVRIAGSIGITLVDPGNGSGDGITIGGVLRAADAGMYAAKSAGGDRAVVVSAFTAAASTPTIRR